MGLEQPEWRRVSRGAKELIALAMRAEPCERPSAREVLSHAWVASGDSEVVDDAFCVARLAAALPPL